MTLDLASIDKAFADYQPPRYLLISPLAAVAMEVMERFAGRDRRRIKREVNKAVRRARLARLNAEQPPGALAAGPGRHEKG